MKKWTLISIKAEDNIWEYKKYFRKPNWKLNDYHISGDKNVFIISENRKAPISASILAEFISWNLDKAHIDSMWGLIRITKWNQMIIKFNTKSGITSTVSLNNNFKTIQAQEERTTWLFIDTSSIQTLYEKK